MLWVPPLVLRRQPPLQQAHGKNWTMIDTHTFPPLPLLTICMTNSLETTMTAMTLLGLVVVILACVGDFRLAYV